MGPLALADLIGLDVVLAMAKTMQSELRDTRYRQPASLLRLVLAGDLGRKSGRGIYDYSDAQNPVINAAFHAEADAATGT
jgi:3-hydroxybutyryl-CoA dehydrogenase